MIKHTSNAVKLYGISFIIVQRDSSISIEPKYDYDYHLTIFQQNILLEIQNKLFNNFINCFMSNDTLYKIRTEFEKMAQEVRLDDTYFPGNLQAELYNEMAEMTAKEKEYF